MSPAVFRACVVATHCALGPGHCPHPSLQPLASLLAFASYPSPASPRAFTLPGKHLTSCPCKSPQEPPPPASCLSSTTESTMVLDRAQSILPPMCSPPPL